MSNNQYFQSNFTKQFICDYVNSQLNSLYPDGILVKTDLELVMDEVIDRLVFSLKSVKIRSHQRFSHLHSDLYAQFLYFLSNTAWKAGKQNLAEKAYYLNKTLHSLNCMYDTELPDIFLFFHAVGTVLGKATYKDYLVVNQGVTVGTNKNMAPVIGKGVMLRPSSTVIGNSVIGDYSVASANAFIFDALIPEGSIIIGSSPDLLIKPAKRFLIKDEVFFGLE